MRGYHARAPRRQPIHTHDFALFLADLFEDNVDWFRSGVSEHSLISRLQAPALGLFSKEALRDPLLMFRTHFIVFHALYLVRDRWRCDKTGELKIHTLNILLQPTEPGLTLPDHEDKLREYYLNWDNFSQTSESDVDALLDDFWRQLGGARHTATLSQADIAHARQVLGLEPGTVLTLKQVKRQYRKLVHRHHPDKGGSAEAAKELVHAYGVVCASLRQV